MKVEGQVMKNTVYQFVEKVPILVRIGPKTFHISFSQNQFIRFYLSFV